MSIMPGIPTTIEIPTPSQSHVRRSSSFAQNNASRWSAPGNLHPSPSLGNLRRSPNLDQSSNSRYSEPGNLHTLSRRTPSLAHFRHSMPMNMDQSNSSRWTEPESPRRIPDKRPKLPLRARSCDPSGPPRPPFRSNSKETKYRKRHQHVATEAA